MAHDNPSPDVIRRLVDTAWSADTGSAGPDDLRVRGFAEFGLPPDSPLVTGDQLRDLEVWRNSLQIPANSAFLDGTLLLTVKALLGPDGPDVLTPVTLWELIAFIDALISFDRLYCIANPVVDASFFNRQLGSDVLTAIPDPDGGMLRTLAAQSAADGVLNMEGLRGCVGAPDAFGQEVQAVVDGWRAVLGPDFPSDGPFDIRRLDIGLAELTDRLPKRLRRLSRRSPKRRSSPASTFRRDDPPSAPSARSAALADGAVASGESPINFRHQQLRVLIYATRVPQTPMEAAHPPLLSARQQLAANATYRTYVNQGIANALALPYLPGTLRMPFRQLLVERASQIQDELCTVAEADKIFAQQEPSSPLKLPFFTSAVLQRATTRDDIWAQMAQVRAQSDVFRQRRAELDRILERSGVSPEAVKIKNAIRDDGLKLADLAGAAQQSASVALGVVAQTGIVPLAPALKTGVDAARGLGRSGSWTRIWRRLFHRHEHFLAQTNSQAIALTNALPQLQQLWEMPKIGGYLKRFASATQQMGHVLRD